MSRMESPTLKTTEHGKETETQLITSQNKENVKQDSEKETKYFTSVTTIEITESNDNNNVDDIVILRRDPTTKRNFINKSAYAKLHRTLSPGRAGSTIGNLKEKYENKKPDLLDVKTVSAENVKTEYTKEDGVTQQTYRSKRTSPVKLDEETVQSLKNKYSPGSFGYPRTQKNSKLPVPKPRGAVKSQIILPSSKQVDKSRLRYSLDVGKKPKPKDENSNELSRKNSSSSGEFITIITRSESETSVDKFEKELNLFTMDGKPKEKKRGSSFKKIFSGRIFGKDKKKKDEEKNKLQIKESSVSSDNFQNETNSFSRKSNYRHTTDGVSHKKPQEAKVTRSESERFSQPKKIYITKDMEEKYAQMHINQFHHIKQSFEKSESTNQAPQGYVRMDKPIIVRNSPGPTNYMNLPNVRKYIDTSSSASTLESEQSNIYQNTSKGQEGCNELCKIGDGLNTATLFKFDSNKDPSRDTPPRAQETRQGVRLVNPKALIPINSERPLPNPYQNSENSISVKSLSTSNEGKVKNQSQPHFEETYGTVFDSLEYEKNINEEMRRTLSKSNNLRPIQKPPKSPSLESTKLKLPSNREIIPLSPRMKSPIPHDNISTEKIIATELLKPTKSPPPPRKNISRLSGLSHQNLEIDIDYPDNINIRRKEMRIKNISAKPPVSKTPFRKSPETNTFDKQRLSRQSPSFDYDRTNQTSPFEDRETIYPKYRSNKISTALENDEQVTTDATVHAHLPRRRTPTPNSLLHNRSLSPVRPQSVRSSTPVDVSNSPSTKSSPQKEDMRKSVEAYYWKEIKKLKEQENYDLYLYQMQMIPYGYLEDPVSVRRSRSLSPTTQRNSRRSLSLPRESRSSNAPNVLTENPYGRKQPHSIPEGRAVVSQQPLPGNVIYGTVQDYRSNFRRNTPERRTIEGIPRDSHSLYKPIFKRGSLTTPVREYPEDFQNKKVSFSNSSANVETNPWPTKDGFTQSPPQRRIDRRNTLEDDVFLPATPRNQFDAQEIYGYANKPPNLLYDYRTTSNDTYQRPKQREPIYGPNSSVRYRQEYGQPQDERIFGEADSQSVILRPNSVQIQEPLYGQRQLVSRRMSYDNANLIAQRSRNHEPQYVNRQQIPPQREPRYGYKREIIVTDEIFGQFGGYIAPNTNDERYIQSRQLQNPIYSSTQSVAAEPIYGKSGTKQVSVSDKVCDIYGQIHDRNSPSVISPNHVKRTGIILGELQRSPGSPQVSRQSYSHLPNEQFARNSRLTASANDMYRRTDPRYRSDLVYDDMRFSYQESGAPTRPLPPVPIEKKIHFRNNYGKSDTESISDTSELQKIMNNGAKNKNRSFFEEEWNADGKSGRGISGNDSGRSDNESGEVRGRSRNTRRDDPRRHTLGAEQQYLAMAGQGGPLSRTMDLEGQPRGYALPSNAMLFDDDPGIMSEVETSSTGFRRGGKQRSSLPVVRTPSKTLERPLGLVFLQYRNETKRALLPNEITSIDTVKALFVRSFPKQLTMEYLDSPNVKIYIHDSSKDMFYELEDLRSHLREIRDRSVLRLFESADVSGGLPMAGIGIAGGVGHFEDPSYFSEPEFDSEYQHQHIHKSKGSAGKSAPYYMGSTASLPRGATLLRTYSPAVATLPAERMKPLPTGAPPKPQRAYSTGAPRSSDGPPRPPDRFVPFQRPANPLYTVPDGYMSSPERGSRYEDPYYSQYATRSGSITPVIDEEISDTELLDESYSLYGVKLPPGGGPRVASRSPFPPPASVPPYDATRLRVENMERQLANLTGLVQKALTQPTASHLQVPGRENYRGDEFDKNSSSSSASLPDETYLRSDSKAPKLGKSGCHKSVSFEKSVSFSDEPPDMNSPKQHSPQHAADTKPAKPAIKSSTLPRTSSQERDRLKPAPPPKPASLSPGQYDSRIYRDLQLTPEMYNQLRGLQKKAKDLRAEVRNLRRMSQAQAHSVKETIRDTFIKIRAMLLAGGEQVWQAGMDQERVRLTREEDLYKQEMLRLETDLSDLESTVEELRGNVINRKTRVNMSDVENMALVLSKSSKTVADLKLRFPGLQDGMKAFLSTEMEKAMREEKFLKEEPERLESALRRCKKLTGTLVTLKRLASVQEQRLPCSNSSDGRLSPTSTETPPVTPSSTHSKPPTAPRVGSLVIGGDCSPSDSGQRPENALDALLDELQTFSKPHSNAQPQDSPDPPAIPVKGNRPPQMSEIGRKGSMDSASFLPAQNLSVSTATGSLRRLHSYPSGSDTDNSPPIQPLQRDSKTTAKPPIPERNTELLQHLVTGKRVPPPPPPRTSSKSPLASPTSPSLPPRSPAAALQHIQNVQNMVDKPMSQFEQATQNLGLQTLRRNVPNRSSLKDKSQTLPRNLGSNLQVLPDSEVISASNSSSCESVNSQDGSKKTRKEELEQRHQELLKKQKALQEQYARLQQLQRGNNTLTVVPPAPDQLLKKTGSESNLLQKMGLQLSTSQITGSLTNLPNTSANAISKSTLTSTNSNPTTQQNNIDDQSKNLTKTTTQTTKVYETDIL